MAVAGQPAPHWRGWVEPTPLIARGPGPTITAGSGRRLPPAARSEQEEGRGRAAGGAAALPTLRRRGRGNRPGSGRGRRRRRVVPAGRREASVRPVLSAGYGGGAGPGPGPGLGLGLRQRGRGARRRYRRHRAHRVRADGGRGGAGEAGLGLPDQQGPGQDLLRGPGTGPAAGPLPSPVPAPLLGPRSAGGRPGCPGAAGGIPARRERNTFGLTAIGMEISSAFLSGRLGLGWVKPEVESLNRGKEPLLLPWRRKWQPPCKQNAGTSVVS